MLADLLVWHKAGFAHKALVFQALRDAQGLSWAGSAVREGTGSCEHTASSDTHALRECRVLLH